MRLCAICVKRDGKEEEFADILQISFVFMSFVSCQEKDYKHSTSDTDTQQARVVRM
jgi:hypothetical protein